MISKKALVTFANTDGGVVYIGNADDGGLIGEDGTYTNLGLLYSDQCTHTIKIAVFEGEQKTIFKDRREFDGSLLKQLTEIRRNTK